MDRKNIYQFILAALLLLGSSELWAAGVPGPGFEKAMQERAKAALAARFTQPERAFFKKMTLEAAGIVKTKIVDAEAQISCITRYLKDPASCPSGKDALFSVKEAYKLYQNSYYLANHDEVMRNYALAPGGLQYIRLATPFSNKSLRLDLGEINHLRQLRKDDEDFIASQHGACRFTMEDKQSFYNMQLGQIVTVLPVVLFINLASPDFMLFGFGNKHEEVQDADVVAAYQELLANFDATYDQFMNYEEENLEGLIYYQMLASRVVASNPTYWGPIHEGLNKKLLPQTGTDQFFYWFKNTFFSLNTLFIGCAVIASGTGAPFVALACGLAAAANQGGIFIKSIEQYNEYYREWVSGVRDWETVSAQRLKVQIDFVLTLFNVYALKGFVAGVSAADIARMSAWATSIRESTSEVATKHAVDKFLVTFVKEQGMDIFRGEYAVPFVFGLGYRQMLEMQDIEKVSNIATEIVKQYKEKGYYTFKDRNERLCNENYAAQ